SSDATCCGSPNVPHEQEIAGDTGGEPGGNHQSESSRRASTFGKVSKAANVPASAISRAAVRKPPHAARANVPPTLIRRTPRLAASATVVKGALMSRFTGLGETAET